MSIRGNAIAKSSLYEPLKNETNHRNPQDRKLEDEKLRLQSRWTLIACHAKLRRMQTSITIVLWAAAKVQSFVGLESLKHMPLTKKVRDNYRLLVSCECDACGIIPYNSFQNVRTDALNCRNVPKLKKNFLGLYSGRACVIHSIAL